MHTVAYKDPTIPNPNASTALLTRYLDPKTNVFSSSVHPTLLSGTATVRGISLLLHVQGMWGQLVPNMLLMPLQICLPRDVVNSLTFDPAPCYHGAGEAKQEPLKGEIEALSKL